MTNTLVPVNEKKDAVRECEGNRIGNKLSFFNVFWVFVIGSVVGFVLETIWCFMKYGHLESRTSVVFIPFTVIYGIGAAVLYIGVHKLGSRGAIYMFIFGALAGTAVEFFGSYIQEAIFGSVSWDYANAPLNIGGRVCLPMSLIWGGLSVAWFKWLQPRLTSVIGRIPQNVKRPLTAITFSVLCVCAILSLVAVARWSARVSGTAEVTAFASWIDTAFPDSFMEMVYPNMMFLQ